MAESAVPERRILRATYEDRAQLRAVEDISRRCAVVAGEIAFDATALPVTSIAFLGLTDGVGLDVVMTVPDRNIPERVDLLMIARTLICPWIVLERNGAGYLVGWLRETIANLMAHEVAESLSFRGVRVFDPHSLGGAGGR